MLQLYDEELDEIEKKMLKKHKKNRKYYKPDYMKELKADVKQREMINKELYVRNGVDSSRLS